MQDIADHLPPPQKGHTGYVALLGRPNTGKSTFLNTVLGCHLAAVSAKPQTTRKSMLGIYNDDDSQIVFLDAPGVHPYHIALDEAMAESVSKVIADADLVVCLIDPTRTPGQEDAMVAALAAACTKPVLLVLNKTDLSSPAQRKASLDFYQTHLPHAETYLMTASDPASAQGLIARLKALLPVDIYLYDREEVTTAFERDIAAELIRETLLEKLQDEIPHCIAVTIDSWKTMAENEFLVRATLILEREAHKGIVIGKGGAMIKSIRRASQQKISELCQGAGIFLELTIKVVPNWRKHKQFLKGIRLGE
ncbi:MAG: GTPase Era [Victivallales bacterium]|nr:GTPase Era [Victivallales bacterium]